MLHTHFRLLGASTRTNGQSLLTCNCKSFIILQTGTSTEPLKIYILRAVLVHIRGFHSVSVAQQAPSLAYTPATYAHVVHVTQRCLCLYVRISKCFLVDNDLWLP